MWPVVKLIFTTKEYTLGDKINYMKGSMFSLRYLMPDVLNSNLSAKIDSMQVPVYIFQGKYDYQTPYIVAKDFFEQLKAPEKEFFTFENSAHSPVMEEIEKFNSIVLEKIKADSQK
jgi:pimeloyl-ACP methyl ester carboxylesterase